MDNVTFETFNGITYAFIDNGNDQFTSMPKAIYEAQQVEHLTEIPTV